jgi:hypothetical protein
MLQARTCASLFHVSNVCMHMHMRTSEYVNMKGHISHERPRADHVQRYVSITDIVVGWFRRLFVGSVHIDTLVPIYDRLVAVGLEVSLPARIPLSNGPRERIRTL